MSFAPFDIVYEDDDFVAINKPCGILVHRTKISEDTVFVLQLLRNQLRQRIYPVHRLDRATSGVLIFGKRKEAAAELGTLFMEKQITKTYLAIVRGFLEAEATVDYAIPSKENGARQSAVTHYKRLEQIELPIMVNRYPSSRYCLVQIQPETGRWRQIRRHFSHLRHPIIGDKKHGDVKHNKYFAQQWEIQNMLLHAWRLEFQHPFTNQSIIIQAALPTHFLQALEVLGLNFKPRTVEND